MVTILDIKGRQILDSRGNPTIEVDVILSDGSMGRAAVPSGASTGKYEAVELRDKDKAIYNGMGVKQAIKNVNTEIFDILSGRDPFDQKNIDSDMIELDGTDNKSRLGANAILGVSMAVARSAASSLQLPLWKYIGGIRANTLPLPMMNIINGGAHANNGLDFQECMIMPIGFSTFSEALRAGTEIFVNLKNLLSKKGFSNAVGDEGGFAPEINNLKEALLFISEAIEISDYTLGKDIFIEKGAKISCCILNSKTGPIYIGKNSEIMEGSIIRGPFSLGDNSVVKMGAKIYGPTSIGPHCKVGGEINNSVFFGFSSKAHDGFLGNSIIGEWCNLGADSNNSNLKKVQSDWCANIFCSFHAIAKYERRYKGCQSPDRRVVNEVR